jgi:hypothetical protein
MANWSDMRQAVKTVALMAASSVDQRVDLSVEMWESHWVLKSVVMLASRVVMLVDSMVLRLGSILAVR